MLRRQLAHADIERFEKSLLRWTNESDSTTTKKEVLL